MRTNVSLALLCSVAFFVSAARGQYPTGPTGGAGSWNRGPNSPLSPWLNLTNGGNPATNYFNFVRPNLTGPNRAGFGGMPPGSPAQRALFPTLQNIDEDDLPGQRRLPKKNEKDDKEEVRVALPPTGHAAGFTNAMGYFGPLMAAQGGIGSAGRGAATGRRR